MAKKVIKWDDEDEYDFGVIGISYHNKGRRLCWEFNHNLGLDFGRSDDLLLFLEDQECSFVLYEHFEDEYSLHLIGNKGDNSFLVPEKKSFDYFIIIKNDERGVIKDELLKKTKQVNQVNIAVEIVIDNLKSKQNLLIK